MYVRVSCCTVQNRFCYLKMEFKMNFPQKKRGLLIAIEGTDASGKETQSKRLHEFINTNIGPCVLYSFPRYETDLGKKIKSLLVSEEPWTIKKLNKLAYLFALDRDHASVELEKHLNEGTYVICDRYSGSMLAYGSSLIMQILKSANPHIKLDNSEGKDKLVVSQVSELAAGEFIISQKHLEFEYLDVIQPDIEFRLLCSLPVIQKRLMKRHIDQGHVEDQFENNTELQSLVQSVYSNQSNISYQLTPNTYTVWGDMFNLELSPETITTMMLGCLQKHIQLT